MNFYPSNSNAAIKLYKTDIKEILRLRRHLQKMADELYTDAVALDQMVIHLPSTTNQQGEVTEEYLNLIDLRQRNHQIINKLMDLMRFLTDRADDRSLEMVDMTTGDMFDW